MYSAECARGGGGSHPLKERQGSGISCLSFVSALELQDGTEGESDGNKRKTPPEEQNAKKRKKSNDNVQKATGGGGSISEVHNLTRLVKPKEIPLGASTDNQDITAPSMSHHARNSSTKSAEQFFEAYLGYNCETSKAHLDKSHYSVRVATVNRGAGPAEAAVAPAVRPHTISRAQSTSLVNPHPN